MKVLLVGVAAALMLAACGGASTPATAIQPTTAAPSQTSTSPTAINYGKQYLDLIKAPNDALYAFGAAAKKDVTAADNHLIVAPTQNVIKTTQDFDSKLLRVQWPASAQADVRALVTADAPLISACEQLLTDVADNNASTTDGRAFSDAAAKVSAAANIVRADLGLPPPAA